MSWNFEQRQAFEGFCKRTNPKYKPTDDSVIDRAAWRIWCEAWDAAANRAIELMPESDIVDMKVVRQVLFGLRGGDK